MNIDDVKKEIARLERILAGRPQFPNLVRAKLDAMRRHKEQLLYMQTHPIRHKIKSKLSAFFKKASDFFWEE